MRCPECGKSNSENSKICGTCGTKLTDLKSSGPKFETPSRKTLMDESKEAGNPTMVGKPASTPSWDQADDYRKARSDSHLNDEFLKNNKLESCPDCRHYPLLKEIDSIICPNCGFSTTSKNANKGDSTFQKQKATERIEGVSLPGAISFSLTNLKTNQKLKFDKEEVVLNRTSLESENTSISREKHAIIAQVNGQWVIEDSSTHQATYIQVNGKLPLLPGTVILIGNQFFKFDLDD
jgi:uncharacterized Zn finger protein (UPF0148 family)